MKPPKLRILIIGKIWPEPTSSAAGSRTLDIIRSLQTVDWEVHFACAAQKSEFSQNLASIGVEEHTIELNDSSFDTWVAELSPDVTIFDRYMTEEQFGWRVESSCADCLRILDTSDLHCLREARRQSLVANTPIDLQNEIALREIASIHRSDLTIMISEYEMELLDSMFAIPDFLTLYFPLLIEDPLLVQPPFEDREHCAMIGSFLHEPNWDAARWCAEHIWPIVREKLPAAELHIYGSYVPEKALQLNSRPNGITVKGRTANATETLSAYRLNLAPLRFGAGLKGKLADAFRAGTPSIATPIAAEAMRGTLPWGSHIAETAEEFANEIVAVYLFQDKWDTARESGYTIARQRFSPKDWLPILPKRIADAVENRAANRRKNFNGQLLRHHQHRSTEFMSRWIEEKNRPR